jgi:hypothetical protein
MNPQWFMVLCCFINFVSYPIISMILNSQYSTFKTYTNKRKNYIIKNYIKYYVLKYISISTLPFTFLVLFDIGDHTNYIHFIGSLYACCDTIALIKDIQLSSSTKIHHTITTILSFINTTINWEQANSIQKLLALYTTLSCYSYDVNYCLGMRFLVDKNCQKEIKQQARQTYLLTCCVNWSIHVIYLLNNITSMHLTGIVYYGLILFIVFDDIVLLKWLGN